MRQAPQTELELDELLTRPDDRLVEDSRTLEGDILVLGAGGKMGPSLAVLARRAIDAAGVTNKVIAVSRFGDAVLARSLSEQGVETISADLLDREALKRLPDCANVIYLAGMKFGSTAAPGRTWAMNVLLPALVAERFSASRIVALSSGNVYPFVDPATGGATEETEPAPTGEYAWSCLGRERMFQHAAESRSTRSVLVRLNYATDLRYGVLHDVARSVFEDTPVDVTMGWLNTIWQGDANAVVLRAVTQAATPPLVLNLTGEKTISIREAAARFGELLGKEPRIVGEEASTALLNNAGRCREMFGPPTVTEEEIATWTADWVRRGGRSLGKPTHFDARDGIF
jgi:nucleoside-diphosphate-sugar epimerase